MTIEDVLKTCSEGVMPNVIDDKMSIGQVTSIRNGPSWKGIGVYYPGIGYEHWYYAEDGKDGRKKYMKNLKIHKIEVKLNK